MGLYGILWWFNGFLMGFYGGLIVFMGLIGGLMGCYGILWWLNVF